MKYIISFIFCLFIIGCSENNSYHLLSIPEQTDKVISGTYSLRYVEIPEYLSRKNLIYFERDGILNRNSNRLWHGDMKDNITRYLYTAIAADKYPPSSSKNMPEYIIDVRIAELIGNKEKAEFYANASWKIIDKDGNLLKNEKIQKKYKHINIDNVEDLIKIHSQSLDDISAAIRLNLKEIYHKR